MKALWLSCALALVATPALAQGGAGGAIQRLLAMDTNNDGQITRAEAEIGRAAGFDRMDTDHDGALSEAERQVLQGRMAAGVARGDANGDGQVSRAEFMAMPFIGFDRLDADHNNVLSAQELEVARNMAGGN